MGHLLSSRPVGAAPAIRLSKCEVYNRKKDLTADLNAPFKPLVLLLHGSTINVVLLLGSP